MSDKVRNVNAGILQCAFERLSINLIMEWEHDFSAVWMFHLNMAAATMRLNKSKLLQRRQNLTP
ncbi:MAG TPA: hypothetical protein VNA16_06800 [Abditibacteriaceae bacterium]|nr:hypothetical protein [Abditibacteriaceae bacterium]